MFPSLFVHEPVRSGEFTVIELLSCTVFAEISSSLVSKFER